MTIRLHPDVVFRILGDIAVLVHLPSDAIYELNATGTRVWTHLERGASMEELVASLVQDYEVDAPTAERECEQLIDDLVARGLVQR